MPVRVDPTDGRFMAVHDHADKNGTRWLIRAVYQATGEYIVPLPGDARVAPHGLLEIARAIAASGRADLIYADEDAVDGSEARLEPRLSQPGTSSSLLGAMWWGSHLRSGPIDSERSSHAVSRHVRTLSKPSSTISRCVSLPRPVRRQPITSPGFF